MTHRLLRKASSLPPGSPERVRILRRLKAEYNIDHQVEKAFKMDQVDPTVAKLITQSGHLDGDVSDDKVSVSKGSWSAARLKPSQSTMVLAKALGMALGMLKSGKIGGDLGALVSSDGHILDGHHRWAATILASGSSGVVGGYKVGLPGDKLLKVLNIISKGMFNVRNGKPGSGNLKAFTPGNVHDMLNDFTQNGISGKFPISGDSVRQILTDNFGSVEEGVEQMSQHANLITKSVPSWAPDRKQMPVIEPGNVPAAAKALTNGDVDWNSPHRQASLRRASTLRLAQLTAVSSDRLLKLARELPQGDPDRQGILGLLKARHIK